MITKYPVLYGKKQVGTVCVQRVGLYYRFICRCRIPRGEMCRIRVICGEKQENLGILVPSEDGFTLDTRLPVKRIGEGEMEFLLIPKVEKTEGCFVSVYPDEPFAYISRLKDAYLATRNGQTGIILK